MMNEKVVLVLVLVPFTIQLCGSQFLHRHREGLCVTVGALRMLRIVISVPVHTVRRWLVLKWAVEVRTAGSFSCVPTVLYNLYVR